MMRSVSQVAPNWWDYTTLDRSILDDAARLTVRDLEQLSRPGFTIHFYETSQEFYCAEALEYIHAWQQSTRAKPVGVCGPIGPTEQLPLVAQMVNALGLKLHNAHFWGMDEWVVDGREVDECFPLGFKRADLDLCFHRIYSDLAMPEENLHFPAVDIAPYEASWEHVRCALMQGGQGEVKHWAFNDPFRREGPYADAPPTAEEYYALGARLVELHPITLIQNARTSGGGVVQNVPASAITVGPKQTWMAEKVSIWHPGHHDNPFGMRLTALMISKKIVDTAVPISLLAGHPNVHFSYLRSGVGECAVVMH